MLNHVSNLLNGITFSMCCIQFLAKLAMKGKSFFPMFGRNHFVSFNSLLKPMLDTKVHMKYSINGSHKEYVLPSCNQPGTSKKGKVSAPKRKFKEGDPVLLQYHKAKVWDGRYTGDHWIVLFPGKAQVKVVNATGKTNAVHIFIVKYIFPVDRVIMELPDYQSFGR